MDYEQDRTQLLLHTVVYCSGFHQKFTVIDQQITWYGSVNFLSFGSAEESIMRLERFDIADQLTDTVTSESN